MRTDESQAQHQAQAVPQQLPGTPQGAARNVCDGEDDRLPPRPEAGAVVRTDWCMTCLVECPPDGERNARPSVVIFEGEGYCGFHALRDVGTIPGLDLYETEV